MNYPVWELQASGLLIALISILHVFVSHIAVGGGLFLVLAEGKARREGDAALLDYVRGLSRFFILLTLVFGAITGVGIWFAISLVHPAATSSLINTFVWGWAIEWTFFLVEIAAAMVYYHGWDRLSARQHLLVGWIYFAAAYFSLVVINGILSYMLTPGDWLVTRRFWDGFFNPTYWPSLAARTVGALGLAGLWAIFTAAFLKDAGLKTRVARYAGLGWVLPMAVALPFSLAWYFSAAASAGVGLDEIFAGPVHGLGSLIVAAFTGPAASGYPVARIAARVVAIAIVALLATVAVVLARRGRYGRVSATLVLICGLFSIGGAEWVREDIRKPFVIGGYLFVNGVRLPPAPGAPVPPAGHEADPFSLDALRHSGILAASPWVRLREPFSPGDARAEGEDPRHELDEEAQAGSEIFRLACSACHTLDGYHAIRPLVKGRSSSTLEGVISRLAVPAEGGGDAAWAGTGLRVKTWLGRRMPPFPGTDVEARALSVHLARIGGGEITPAAPASAAPDGAQIFESACAVCHGPEGEWPIEKRLRGRSAGEFYDLIGRLPEVNPDMPPFEGTDAERRALADHLGAWAAHERREGEGDDRR